MRLPRVRFAVKRMMLAVAAVALVMGAGLTLRRWSLCLQRASYHGSEATRCEGNARVQLAGARANSAQRRALTFDAGQHTRRAAWHRQLAEVYRHVRWRPWEAIPPVPVEPPWEPTTPEPPSEGDSGRAEL